MINLCLCLCLSVSVSLFLSLSVCLSVCLSVSVPHSPSLSLSLFVSLPSHLFQFLHWLPVQHIVQYKINTLCYKCITGTAPSYLRDCPKLYTPSHTLRSASHTLSLQIPRTRLDLHCWFPRLFCFPSINMEYIWPSPSSQTETLSGLVQMQP